MRTILAMVRKDLMRRLRSPLGVLATLAFPVVFAAMIAVSFGTDGEPPKLRLLVENLDDGPLGGFLMSAMTSDQAAARMDVHVVEDDGIERLEDGDGSALLIIPERFSEDVIQARPTSLRLVRNPSESIMPEVAEQLAGVLTEGLDAASHALRGPLDEISPLIDADDGPTDDQVVGIALGVKHSMDSASALLFPPVIDFDSVVSGADADEDEEESSEGTTGLLFLMILPGVSVYALFLIGDIAMRDILTEGEEGTLRRQIAGPVGAGTIVLGKAAYTFVLSLLALAVLTGVGAVFLRRPVDPFGFLVLSVAVVLAVTGAGATVYGAAGSQRRGATISSVVYLVLAFSGGAFMPASQLPAMVQRVAPISPFYWGSTGYTALLEGGGIVDVATHVAVLGGLGVVLLAAGAALMRRQLMRGAAA